MQIELSDLQKIFKTAFEEEVEISIQTRRDDVDQWDSINHLNLIVELEDSLKISFTKEEIENLDSVKQLLQILAAK
jgi:acyl carrier protein